MLVLKRKLDESIIIGDSIEVKILEIKGDYVKVGISAPLDISVHRKEVYLAIQQENVASAKLPSGLLQNAVQSIKKKK